MDLRDIEKRSLELAKKRARMESRVLDKREKRFQGMLENQMNALENFYKVTNDRSKTNLKKYMDSNNEIMSDMVQELENNFIQYGKFMDKETRTRYKDMFLSTKDSLEKIQDTYETHFGKLHKDIDEELEKMSDTVGGRFRNFAKNLQDTLVALNIADMAGTIKDGVSDAVDSYVQNMRERQAKYNGGLNRESYRSMVDEVVNSSYGYSRNEASEIVNQIMDDTGLKKGEFIKPYLNQVADLTKALGTNISDLQHLIEVDGNMGGQGAIMQGITNMAVALGNDMDLSTDTNELLASINENIYDIYGLSRGDAKIQKGMSQSMLTLTSITQAEYNKGVDEAGGKVMDWAKKSIPELLEDSEFIEFSSRAGMTADQFRQNIDTGNADKVLLAMQDVMRANDGNAFALHQASQAIGFSSDAIASQFVMSETLRDNLDKLKKDIANAEDGYTNTTQESMAKKRNGPMEKIANAISNNFVVKEFSDFFAEFDVTLANAANAAIVASKGMDTVHAFKAFMGKNGDIIKVASKQTLTYLKSGGIKDFIKGNGGFGNTLGMGLEKAFNFLSSKLFGAGGLITRGLKNTFAIITANAPSSITKALTKAGSVLKPFSMKIANSLVEAFQLTFGRVMGGLLKGVTKSGVFRLLGNVLTKAFAFGGFILDFFDGLTNVKEWLGSDTLGDKIIAGIAGAIGGSGEGGIMNAILNALKGAMAGAAVGGPIGAIAGAILGGIAGYFGAKNIAKALKGIKDGLISTFTGIVNAIQDYVADSWIGQKLGLRHSYDPVEVGGYSASQGLGNSSLIAQANANNAYVADKNAPGSYAGGLSNVPFDNYPAWLHKGEAVLTASQAGLLRSDGGINPMTSMATGIAGALNQVFGIKTGIGRGKSPIELIFRGVFGIDNQDTYGKGGLFGNIFSSIFNLGPMGTFGGLGMAVAGGGKSLLDALKKLVIGDDSPSSSNGSPGTPSKGTGDMKKIWDFFAKDGFTNEGIAGIMGNLFEESGFRSGAVEGDGGQNNTEYLRNAMANRDSFVNDEVGFGLAQWTSPDRKAALWDFANKMGKSLDDLDMQLAFMLEELNNGAYKSVADLLKGNTTIEEASAVFGSKYEGFGTNSEASRLAHAKEAYSQSVGQYAQGTPWVPDTQVALIHGGEMIVPAEFNPNDSGNYTSVSTKDMDSGNDDVVEAIKWQVYRLEAKLDTLIGVMATSGRSTGITSHQSSVDDLLMV